MKSKLFIVAHRRTWGLLDGEYASVFRGRSLDYDDLREYVIGDEVRDIDWKATARHGSPLVKRWIASRTQTVLFVVDTGRGMAAQTSSGEPKSAVAITLVGMLGHLALRHGDLVGLVEGDSESTHGYAAQGREGHLERLLRVIQTHTTLASPKSRLHDQLDRRYALPAAAAPRGRGRRTRAAGERRQPRAPAPRPARDPLGHREDADPTSAGHGDTAVDVGRTSLSPPRCGSTGGCTTRTPRP